MKAILGTDDDVIGLGLTGIQQRKTLPMDAGIEAINRALTEFHDNTTTVYINESLLRKLRYHDDSTHDTTFIMIPDTTKTPDIDEIETMAKETLGIDI